MGDVKSIREIPLFVYLEPVCPLFCWLKPAKQGLFQSKQGSFGFQVHNFRCEFLAFFWKETLMFTSPA